ASNLDPGCAQLFLAVRRLLRYTNATLMNFMLRLSAPFAAVLLACATGISFAAETALDRYVHAPHPAYQYELFSNHTGGDCTVYQIKFTAQSCLTAAEVNQTIWWHWLPIPRPKEVKSDTASLFITGGNNNGPNPRKPDGNLDRIAK